MEKFYFFFVLTIKSRKTHQKNAYVTGTRRERHTQADRMTATVFEGGYGGYRTAIGPVTTVCVWNGQCSETRWPEVRWLQRPRFCKIRCGGGVRERTRRRDGDARALLLLRSRERF